MHDIFELRKKYGLGYSQNELQSIRKKYLKWAKEIESKYGKGRLKDMPYALLQIVKMSAKILEDLPIEVVAGLDTPAQISGGKMQFADWFLNSMLEVRYSGLVQGEEIAIEALAGAFFAHESKEHGIDEFKKGVMGQCEGLFGLSLVVPVAIFLSLGLTGLDDLLKNVKWLAPIRAIYWGWFGTLVGVIVLTYGS